MAQNEVSVKLTVEEQQAINAISKIINATDKLERETVKSGRKMDRAFSSFAGNLAAIAASKAISGITNSIGGLVDAAADLEVFETQFKTILGSSAAAQAQLKDLQEFAASTPFQLPGLALSTRQLLSFGVAQADVIPTLKNLGDLAAGAGAQIDELTIPFGRLISTQKLTLVELDKFADRGINIYAELAKQTGASIKDIRDNISKGKVPFEEFTTAIENLTGPQGKFFNGMQSQSETLSGVLSTLQDNFFNLQGEIGKAFKPALISSAKTLTEVLKNFADAFADNGPELQKTFSSLANFLVVTPAKFWVDFFSGENTAGPGQAAQEIEFLEQKIASIQDRMRENEDSLLYNSFLGKKGQDQEEMAEAIERLTELQAIVDEKRATELEKIKVQNEEKKKLKEKEVNQQLEAQQKLFDAEDKAREKRKKKADADFKLEQVMASQRVGLFANTGNLINAIAGKQTKAGFLLNQAAAAGQVLIADGQARASALAAAAAAAAFAGPLAPAKFAADSAFMQGLITANTALSLATIAAQTIGSFQSGGVIGGINGATMGRDNAIANVRTGEMVLNADQQGRLFNFIEGRGDDQGGGLVGEVRALRTAILTSPVIIEVDGKEIARANRTAIEEGFGSA